MKLPDLGHRHTPSREKDVQNIWWDFMLHSNQLYDRKTGIATCYNCGARIKVPVEYGKDLPLIAYKMSIGTTAIFRLLLNVLHDHTTIPPILIVITAVLSATLLLYALLKVAISRILTNYSWICFDDADKSSVVQETIKDNKRIRYCISLGIATTYTIVLLTQSFG